MKKSSVYLILRRLVDGAVPAIHREKVLRWMVADQETEEKEEALRRIWLETESEADESTYRSLSATHLKIRQARKEPTHLSIFQRVLQYAAIFLVFVLTGAGGWFVAESSHEEVEMLECYVPNGEQRTILLSDGSEVCVNAGTLLVYPKKFVGKERSLYLSGEANFSVTKNTEKPFIVHAGALNIKVLGTKFNVDAYPGTGKIATVLEQGSVRVYKTEDSSRSVLMSRDEQLTYDISDDSFIKMPINASEVSAWTYGELYFKDQTLLDILPKIERRYNVRIKLSPEIESEDQFSIKFRENETIEDVMRILTLLIQDMTYRQEGDNILLYMSGKEVRKK
ncbi:MAG: DUF4974 domain-containing protein [Parabacteroides sp.]|nr:DUF4974 domain-containing protein [Parabacteroides sp.]